MIIKAESQPKILYGFTLHKISPEFMAQENDNDCSSGNNKKKKSKIIRNYAK